MIHCCFPSLPLLYPRSHRVDELLLLPRRPRRPSTAAAAADGVRCSRPGVHPKCRCSWDHPSCQCYQQKKLRHDEASATVRSRRHRGHCHCGIVLYR